MSQLPTTSASAVRYHLLRDCPKLEPSAHGLDFGLGGLRDVPLSHVCALIAFEASSASGDRSLQLVCMLEGQNQPLRVEASNIRFHAFKIIKTSALERTLQGLVDFLRQQAPFLVLNTVTEQWLDGGRLDSLNRHQLGTYLNRQLTDLLGPPAETPPPPTGSVTHGTAPAATTGAPQTVTAPTTLPNPEGATASLLPPWNPSLRYERRLQQLVAAITDGENHPAPSGNPWFQGLLLMLSLIVGPLLYALVVVLIAGLTWYLTMQGFDLLLNVEAHIGRSRRRGRGYLALLFLLPALLSLALLASFIFPLFKRSALPPGQGISVQPRQEPVLFGFVQALAERLGLAAPQSIEVTDDVHVFVERRPDARSAKSPGKSSGKPWTLVLGLPLVAGLSVEQLVGHLVYQLAPWASSARGGVLGKLYDWHEKLHHTFQKLWLSQSELVQGLRQQAREQADVGSILLGLFAFFLAIGQALLSIITGLNRLMSRGLRDSEEERAQWLESQWVGEDVASTRRRAQDIVSSIQRRLFEAVESAEEPRGHDNWISEILRQRAAAGAPVPSSVSPTHRPRFRCPLPAAVLWRDLPSAARSLSRETNQALGLVGPSQPDPLTLPPPPLAPSVSALSGLWGQTFSRHRFLPVPQVRPSSPADESALRDQLVQSYRAFETNLGNFRKLVLHFDLAVARGWAARQARLLLEAGLQGDPADFGLPRWQAEAALAVEAEAVSRQLQLSPTLAQYESLTVQRLNTGLAWSNRGLMIQEDPKETPWAILAKIHSVAPSLNQLKQEVGLRTALQRQLTQHGGSLPPQVEAGLQRRDLQLTAPLAAVYETLGDVDDVLQVSDGDALRLACLGLPEVDEDLVRRVLGRVERLYLSLLEELATKTTAAEHELGLPPLKVVTPGDSPRLDLLLAPSEGAIWHGLLTWPKTYPPAWLQVSEPPAVTAENCPEELRQSLLAPPLTSSTPPDLPSSSMGLAGWFPGAEVVSPATSSDVAGTAPAPATLDASPPLPHSVSASVPSHDPATSTGTPSTRPPSTRRRLPVLPLAAGLLIVALLAGVWMSRRPEVNGGTEIVERQHAKDGSTLVRVPGGLFTQGADDFRDSSKPSHTVVLSSFWIAKTPVTNAQFLRFFKENPQFEIPELAKGPKFNQPQQPVVGVTWQTANAYCQWAGLELPSEAQWEAAARGLEGRTYPWGEEPPDATRANFNGDVDKTTPVGTYPTGIGPYGTEDQAGNVLEWCADMWDEEAYQARDGSSNPLATEGEYGRRVVRGGSWGAQPFNIVSARRRGIPEIQVDNRVGFRCAAPDDTVMAAQEVGETAAATPTDIPTEAGAPLADRGPRARASTVRKLLVKPQKASLPLVHGSRLTYYRSRNSREDSQVVFVPYGEQSFWVSRYPVTQKQFVAFLEAHPKHPKPGHIDDDDRHSTTAVRVSWYNAQAYCQWAGMSLPTEEQWLRALFGDGSEDRFALIPDGNLWTSKETPVEDYPLSGAGAFGTLGQVGLRQEWTADRGEAEESSSGRIVRGSIKSMPHSLSRLLAEPRSDEETSHHAFRCTLPAPPESRERFADAGKSWRPKLPAPERRHIDGSVLVQVPAGSYTLGFEGPQEGYLGTATPRHTVQLTAFWIGKHEITRQQYENFAAAASRPLPKAWKRLDHPRQPAMWLTWQDADAYCRWNGMELPSEAQWEAAARGTDGRLYPWGDDPPRNELTAARLLIHASPDTVDDHPMGAGPFGTLDQAGGAKEWVRDTWTETPYQGREGAVDPVHLGGDTGVRVLRGGSYGDTNNQLMSAFRSPGKPDGGGANGFRCALME